MEFEDRSNRKTTARLIVMSEIDIRSSAIPSPDDMNELVKRVADMVGSLRNAKGSCWHVEEICTGTFPPGEMHKPFDMLIKMHNMIGSTAIWAATMAQIYSPLMELREAAVALSGTARELARYMKDIATARSNSERLSEHCKECSDCRQFYDRFESDATRYLENCSKEDQDLDGQVEELLRKPVEGGCN